MSFDVTSRWDGKVKFTADIEALDSTAESIKMGMAAVWGHKNEANLGGADLSGVSGINDWIKCIQIDTYPITYTAEILQIGCESHPLDEWREFDDERIIRMDGKKALQFWRKYKDWIFQTIELCPARPTGAAKTGPKELEL